MSNAVVPISNATQIENVLVNGDVGKMPPEQRLAYYQQVCSSLGLNPLTKPFSYIVLNGKTVLYALKDCTEQLRNNRGVSLQIPSREVHEGVYVVTARATLPSGRQDESTGAVSIDALKGEARANAMMKAETKAKRRVTLSICGLGMLDETEVETIPNAKYENTEQQGQAETSEQVRERRLLELRGKANPDNDPEEIREMLSFVRSNTAGAAEAVGKHIHAELLKCDPIEGDYFYQEERAKFIAAHTNPKRKYTPQENVDFACLLWRKVEELRLLRATADSGTETA